MDAELGRLIRSLKEKCKCGHPLQLRARKLSVIVRGEQQLEEEQYKVCGYCGEEIEIPLRDRKKRVVRVDKTAFVKELVEEKRPRRYDKNASDKKRPTVKSGDAKTGHTGYRGGGR